jgi:hypothetical protein
MAFMLSVTIKSIMLSIILLNVAVLNVVVPNATFEVYSTGDNPLCTYLQLIKGPAYERPKDHIHSNFQAGPIS